MATNDEKDFQAAFNDDVPTSDAGDDDGFGILPGSEEPEAVVIIAEDEPSKEGDTPPATPAQEAQQNAQAASDAQAVNDAANERAATDSKSDSTGGEEAAEQSGEAAKPASAKDKYDLSDVPPEDMQKAKSWVGRLKKIEADLMAQKTLPADAEDAGEAGEHASATSEALEQVADKAGAGGNAKMADAVQQAAEQVESGEMSADEAMKQLAEDFGEPFVRMIEAVARNVAGAAAEEKVGAVSKDVQGVIAHLQDDSQRRHFEQIHDKHPDFMAVADSPEFKAYVANNPGAQKIVDNGSARDINQLLSQFKEQMASKQQETPPQEDPAAAAAEGVRSSGLRLPEPPKRGSDDFATAWNEF